MKRTCYLLILILIKFTHLFSQGVYFKASSNYNISISKQQMPEYFTFQIYVPYGASISGDVNLSVEEFSIASGLNLQGAAGYSFKDFISFELKFSTFSNSEKKFKASKEHVFAFSGETEWNLCGYSLLPTVLFGQTFNKSTVNIFVYSGFGLSKLNIKALLNEDFREYKFDRSYTFSWGYGLEYSYSISKNFSLFTNIGINNTSYTPRKAKLTSSSYSMEYLTTSQKEIEYLDEINNLELGYNSNSPEIRLRETLKLNSFYWGIGIKYTLIK